MDVCILDAYVTMGFHLDKFCENIGIDSSDNTSQYYFFGNVLLKFTREELHICKDDGCWQIGGSAPG